jgi:hypothetical protein
MLHTNIEAVRGITQNGTYASFCPLWSIYHKTVEIICPKWIAYKLIYRSKPACSCVCLLSPKVRNETEQEPFIAYKSKYTLFILTYNHSAQIEAFESLFSFLSFITIQRPQLVCPQLCHDPSDSITTIVSALSRKVVNL